MTPSRKACAAGWTPSNGPCSRLDDGTYGRSVRSGEPIPDERLEADPAAELTISEARAAERG